VEARWRCGGGTLEERWCGAVELRAPLQIDVGNITVTANCDVTVAFVTTHGLQLTFVDTNQSMGKIERAPDACAG
jgi:hypothetical protein